MQKYEAKIELTPNEKDHIIQALDLEFINAYSDHDTYFVSALENKTEKMKEVDGKTTHSIIEYNASQNLFLIEETNITADPGRISDLSTRKKKTVIKRNKDVYKWIGMDVFVAFDYLSAKKKKIACEIYGFDRTAVLKARDYLARMGYRNYISETYDKIMDVRPIIREPLAWTIIALLIGIALIILFI